MSEKCELTGTIVDVPGISVGHADNGVSGCTAILCGEDGAVPGVDVRGSAPGTRETDLLRPTTLVDRVHAVVLSGGSAFGLDAASGVMTWLVEHGVGLDVVGYRVPIVSAAVLFDLPYSGGRPPDKEMGYRAADAASAQRVVEGNVGAGCGASAGKVRDMAHAMKTGLGSASRRMSNGLIVGAIVAVNAFGSVIDPHSGAVLAGVLDDDGVPRDAAQYLLGQSSGGPSFVSNTTIGVVATNAMLTKPQAQKIASWSHDAYARTLSPAHTMFDGDTIFALGTGEIAAEMNVIGTLAVEVMATAVARAATQASSAGGLRSARDFQHR